MLLNFLFVTVFSEVLSNLYSSFLRRKSAIRQGFKFDALTNRPCGVFLDFFTASRDLSFMNSLTKFCARLRLLLVAFTVTAPFDLSAQTTATVSASADRVTSGVRAITSNPANRIAPVPAPGEFFLNLTYEPGVRAVVQVPGTSLADLQATTLPIHILFYLLPNGNTAEQTYGRTMNDSLDRRYGIQHLAAQTRRVRELLAEERTVVAVALEADTLSWPAWRRDVPGADNRLVAITQDLRQQLGATTGTADLIAHSGGGSFIWGFLNAHMALPDWLERVVLIDANYSFSAEDGHGEKLLDWLTGAPQRRLYVLAYDDRHVTLNGKLIVSETGGTWRATDRMARALETRLAFTGGLLNDLETSSALRGRVLLARHPNPERRILHTVLVEKNGLVHTTVDGRAALAPADDLYTLDQETYRMHILP